MSGQALQLLGTPWRAESIDGLQWSFWYGRTCFARDVLGDELEVLRLLRAYRTDEIQGYWIPEYLDDHISSPDGDVIVGIAWGALFSAVIVGLVLLGVAIAHRSVA